MYFAILVMIYLGVGLFGFILFGILCASSTLIYVSFFRFGNFSAVISSNTFSSPFFLSSPFGDPYNANVGTLDVISEIA